MTSTGPPLSTHFTDKFAEPQQVNATALGWTHCLLPNKLLFIHELFDLILYHSLYSFPEEAAPSPLHLPRQSEWELQWHSGLPVIRGSLLGQQLSSHLSSFRTPSGDLMSDSPASCNYPRHIQLILSACCKEYSVWQSPFPQQWSLMHRGLVEHFSPQLY